MRNLFISFLLLISCISVKAEDSIAFAPDTMQMPRYERTFRSRFVQSTYIGVPLFVAGIIASAESDHFRTLRNGCIPSFSSTLDNYIQYTPAVLPIAFKACGLKSESSWGKMVTAEATSFAAVTIIAQGLKRTVHEERPDGSDKHSFPSGHTASAFMSAVILEKEYGHYSPWVGIGAYTMATATGCMRVMNNRHWMGDVISGAGVGIVCAEFGYWVADKLFPREKSSFHPESIAINDDGKKPSFLGFFGGLALPLGNFSINNDTWLKSSTNGAFGLEGAYFPSSHLGIGGRFAAADICYILDGKEQSEDACQVYSFQAGPYLHFPIYGRMFWGARALAGYTQYANASKKVPELRGKRSFSSSTGLYLGLRVKQHMDVRINADYSVMTPHTSDTDQWYHALQLSAGANIRF